MHKSCAETWKLLQQKILVFFFSIKLSNLDIHEEQKALFNRMLIKKIYIYTVPWEYTLLHIPSTETPEVRGLITFSYLLLP